MKKKILLIGLSAMLLSAAPVQAQAGWWGNLVKAVTDWVTSETNTNSGRVGLNK